MYGENTKLMARNLKDEQHYVLLQSPGQALIFQCGTETFEGKEILGDLIFEGPKETSEGLVEYRYMAWVLAISNCIKCT